MHRLIYKGSIRDFNIPSCHTNSDGSTPNWAIRIYVDYMSMAECTVKTLFRCLVLMNHDIGCAIPSVWLIQSFAMLITIPSIWFSLTRWLYRRGKPSKASHRMYLMFIWNVETQRTSMFLRRLNVFEVHKKPSILASLWTMILLKRHLINYGCSWNKTWKHIESFV